MISSIYLFDQVLSLPPHKEIYYSSDQLPDLESIGFRKDDLSEPHGQIDDYRLILKDGSGIHARGYGRVIGFHWDKVDPLENGFEHLRQDSPITYSVMWGSIGAGLGVSLCKMNNKDKDLVKYSIIGGILGFYFGALTAEWE